MTSVRRVVLVGAFICSCGASAFAQKPGQLVSPGTSSAVIPPGHIGDFLVISGKLATAEVTGKSFICSATNAGDTDAVHVALKIYNEFGGTMASADCSAGRPDLGPHASCRVVAEQFLVFNAHCEVLVVTGEQANVRGSITGVSCDNSSCELDRSDAR
jgi:hypothetical protein